MYSLKTAMKKTLILLIEKHAVQKQFVLQSDDYKNMYTECCIYKNLMKEVSLSIHRHVSSLIAKHWR